MKYLITEKPNSLIVFLESYSMKTITGIADLIEDTYPGSVIEVTHNFSAKQGTIILMKIAPDFEGKVKELLI